MQIIVSLYLMLDALRAQLHERSPATILRVLRPRLVDQFVQSVDDASGGSEGVGSEQRDLLDAFAEVALNDG